MNYTRQHYNRMLLACLIFSNRCISHASCYKCESSTFDTDNVDAVCLADSKFISTLKVYLGPILTACKKSCDSNCEYFNDYESCLNDPCSVSVMFCKICQEKPRIDKEDYK